MNNDQTTPTVDVFSMFEEITDTLKKASAQGIDIAPILTGIRELKEDTTRVLTLITALTGKVNQTMEQSSALPALPTEPPQPQITLYKPNLSAFQGILETVGKSLDKIYDAVYGLWDGVDKVLDSDKTIETLNRLENKIDGMDGRMKSNTKALTDKMAETRNPARVDHYHRIDMYNCGKVVKYITGALIVTLVGFIFFGWMGYVNLQKTANDWKYRYVRLNNPQNEFLIGLDKVFDARTRNEKKVREIKDEIKAYEEAIRQKAQELVDQERTAGEEK